MSEPELKWTKDPLRKERFVGALVVDRRARNELPDKALEEIGAVFLKTLGEFEARLRASLVTVTMEDGSKELRFLEAMEVDCDREDLDEILDLPLRLRPELQDGEFLVETIGASGFFIHKEPG